MVTKLNPQPGLPRAFADKSVSALVDSLSRELAYNAARSNNLLPGDGTEQATRPVRLATYTVSTLPLASSYEGGIIYVKNGTTNKRLAISDGTNWRWPDGNVVT